MQPVVQRESAGGNTASFIYLYASVSDRIGSWLYHSPEMHKSTASNPSGFRFFSPSSNSSTVTASTITSPSGATTPGAVTTPDDTHNHQASYFLRSNSSKKPTRPPLNHQKSLDSVTMFGRVGGREYMNVTPVPPLTQTPQSPNAQYEQVFELATKRMATLDYLRRA